MREELLTVLFGMLPISEVRGAIPAAIFAFGFPAAKAFGLAVLGNLLPVAPLLVFFQYFVQTLTRRWYLANRFFSWLFDYTMRRHADHFHYWRWAPLALFVFVAIPLPMTGAWSGAVAAVVFGIPFWYALGTISLGVVSAAGIVTLLTSFFR